jgi:hypothetical protein
MTNHKLTATSQKYFNGHILEQVMPGEDGTDLTEVPLSMKMVTELQNLQKFKRNSLA